MDILDRLQRYMLELLVLLVLNTQRSTLTACSTALLVLLVLNQVVDHVCLRGHKDSLSLACFEQGAEKVLKRPVSLSLACFELLVLNLNIVVYTLVTTLSLACFEPAFMYIT